MGNKLTNKPIKDTMSTTGDYLLAVVGGVLARITPANLAELIATVTTTAARRAVATKTASSYSATALDSIIICDASSNAITINIPASSELYSEATGTLELTIVRTPGSSFDVTIAPNGAETIDEGSSLVIASGNKTVFSDGTNLFSHG